MQITLSFDDFTELPYTSGTVQNISSQATVEICQDDTANSGLILGPGEWFSWSNSTIYARSAWDYEPTAVCAVVPFLKGGEGGGGSEYILPIATTSALGGVKSSTADGKISVDSTGVMTYNEPTPTVEPIVAPAWESGTSYPQNALVSNNSNVYIALVAHTAGADFATDLASGKWQLVGASSSSVNNGGYIQSTQLGIVGSTATPADVFLPINTTTNFCFPPVDVLEIVPGAQDQVIVANTMSSGDAASFNYDSDYVQFNGYMELITSYHLAMSTPTALGEGYISESNVIEPAEYKVIEEVG